MTLFQTIALTGFGVLLVLTLAGMGRRRISLRPGFAWTGVWALGFFLVLFPDTTKVLASVLGIQRGVDVVVYTAIGVTFGALFVVYLRFRKLERQITILTRELAIMDYESKGTSSHRSSMELSPDDEGRPDQYS